jgi:transposase-like protein
MTQRRRYSQEFKHEAVELTRTPGASIGQIARDLGINANMLAPGSRGPGWPGVQRLGHVA